MRFSARHTWLAKGNFAPQVRGWAGIYIYIYIIIIIYSIYIYIYLYLYLLIQLPGVLWCLPTSGVPISAPFWNPSNILCHYGTEGMEGVTSIWSEDQVSRSADEEISSLDLCNEKENKFRSKNDTSFCCNSNPMQTEKSICRNCNRALTIRRPCQKERRAELPFPEVAKLAFWSQTMRKALKRVQKQFSD